MPQSLEGRVALVTGGGSGIGANIARELAPAGMTVWVTGRTGARIETVAAEIGGHALAGDVSREKDVCWLVSAGGRGRSACQQCRGVGADGDV